ncbi:hypothetical protein [Ruegeria lacuscaerulensis]|uniref:hypothetical protein n=1 Tax=Ruegeria lacuscaerulensis TaxID=55218 RepID=UPI00147A376C|nr:hypothetical protein [Ruegeria lacuscaerulensis]
MTENEIKSLAVKQVISACKQQVDEVIVLEGRHQTKWCEAYAQNGISRVTRTSFDTLIQSTAQQQSEGGGLRIVHATRGIPASSLSEAEQSVSQITSVADIIVFSPVPVTEQESQDLLISWPSFWAMLFLAEGYLLRDAIRPKIWHNNCNDWESLQSTVVFTRNGFDGFSMDAEAGCVGSVVDFVHPSILEENLRGLSALQMSNLIKPGFPSASPSPVVSVGSGASEDTTPQIYLALPKRYSKREYETKILQERRAWWKIALRSPWRYSYWGDLWRFQRRSKRMLKIK